MLISAVHAELDVSHIAGHSNDLADRISRLPPDLQASERIRCLSLRFGFHFTHRQHSQRDLKWRANFRFRDFDRFFSVSVLPSDNFRGGL